MTDTLTTWKDEQPEPVVIFNDCLVINRPGDQVLGPKGLRLNRYAIVPIEAWHDLQCAALSARLSPVVGGGDRNAS